MASKTKKIMQGKAESITVRLDPKIKYGLELLARKQRRSLSSVVEWALQKAIYDKQEGLYDEQSKDMNFLDFLWDVEEADRLYLLRTCRPNLLTFEEEKIVKTITESVYFLFLHDKYKNLIGDIKQPSLDYHHKMQAGLRSYFETYKKVALGELGKESLPKTPRGWASKSNGNGSN